MCVSRRNRTLAVAAALCFVSAVAIGQVRGERLLYPKLPSGTASEDDPTLGTQVTWAANVTEAAKKARAEGKLVFVMHLSGDFGREEFT